MERMPYRREASSCPRQQEVPVGIMSWIVLGLIVGAIAVVVHRGPKRGGVIGTLASGIVGAVGGGVIAAVLGIGDIGSMFHLAAWIIAVAASLLLLIIYGALAGTHSPRTHPAR